MQENRLTISSYAFLFPFLLFSTYLSRATAQEAVTLSNSERHVLYSETIDQNFRLDIAMPTEFSVAPTDRYPVVYVLDGDAFLPLVASSARILQGSLELPPTIFVGIGYDTNTPLMSTALRNRDLTPSRSVGFDESQTNRPVALPIQVMSGGAENLITFIDNQIKPFINANYPTDTSKEALVGYSLGGLFATYVLFHHTESFEKYVIGSPSLWWDENISFSYESNYAEDHDSLEANVYLSAGTEESGTMLEDVVRLHRLLESRSHEGLSLSRRILEGETHVSGPAPAIIHGLTDVFEAETQEYLELWLGEAARMRANQPD